MQWVFSSSYVAFFLFEHLLCARKLQQVRSNGKGSLQVDTGHDEWDPEALGPSPASGLDTALLQKSGRGRGEEFLLLFYVFMTLANTTSGGVCLSLAPAAFAKVTMNTFATSSAQHNPEGPAACCHLSWTAGPCPSSPFLLASLSSPNFSA